MAKSGPSKTAPSGNRRDRLASFEAARKKEQRIRTIRLLVICVVAAALVLAVPLYLYYQDYQARNATIAELGVTAAAAGCDPVAEEAGHRQPGARRGSVPTSRTRSSRPTPARTTPSRRRS